MVTNVELDHHSRWALARRAARGLPRASREPARGLALPARRGARPRSPASAAGRWRFDADAPGPGARRCAVPGRHNLLNARAALAALELAASSSSRRRAALPRFPGMLRRLELQGRTRRAPRSTTTTPTTRPRSRRRSRRCASSRPRRLIAVFQPHLYSRTKALAERFGAALAAADEVGVLDVYPAREQPVGELAGVSGLAVARAAADHAGGRPVLVAARRATAPSARSRPRLGEGDLLVTIGAGDIFELADALVETTAREPPDDAPGRSRARLPAGAADDRARGRAGRPVRPPGRRGGARASCSRWAAARGGRRSGWSARARTSWSPTTGIAAWSLKLDGELSAIEREGTRVVCGGGARLPSAAAKAAGWGLAGLEFGINIPGTVGGAVRMNANAYGGELGAGARVGRRLHRRRASSAATPGELGFAYRRSNLRPGEVVSRASFRLAEGDAGGDQGRRSPRCAASAARRSRRGSRPSARPSRTPTDDPAPRGGPPASCSRRRAAAGSRSAAPASPTKHANFVENAGERDDRRRPRADGRGPPPRPRALRGRARARGPGARRGRVARGLGSARLTRFVTSWAGAGPGSANHPRVSTPAATPAGKRRATARTGPPRGDRRRRPVRAKRRRRRAPKAQRPATARDRRSGAAPAAPRRAAAPRAAGRGLPRAALRPCCAVLRSTVVAAAGAAGRGRLVAPWRSPTSAGSATPRWSPSRRQGGGRRAAPTASRSSRALTDAARGMTTLHVQTDRLESAVREFPTVASVSADPSFPHGLTIHVTERQPALVVHAGDRQVAGRRRRLAASRASTCNGPAAGARGRSAAGLGPPERRAARRGAGDRRRAGAAAPADRRRLASARLRDRGDAARRDRAALRNRADRATRSGRRPPRSSPTRQLTALTYVDVRVPERPAVGGVDPSPATTTDDVPRPEAMTASLRHSINGQLSTLGIEGLALHDSVPLRLSLR